MDEDTVVILIIIFLFTLTMGYAYFEYDRIDYDIQEDFAVAYCESVGETFSSAQSSTFWCFGGDRSVDESKYRFSQEEITAFTEKRGFQ